MALGGRTLCEVVPAEQQPECGSAKRTRATYLTAFCRLAYSPAMLRGKKASTTLCGR